VADQQLYADGRENKENPEYSRRYHCRAFCAQRIWIDGPHSTDSGGKIATIGRKSHISSLSHKLIAQASTGKDRASSARVPHGGTRYARYIYHHKNPKRVL
jgi:hypothetical protein